MNNEKILQTPEKDLNASHKILDETNIISDVYDNNDSQTVFGMASYKSNLFFAVACLDIVGYVDATSTYSYSITPGTEDWGRAKLYFASSTHTAFENVFSGQSYTADVIYSPKLGYSIVYCSGDTSTTTGQTLYNNLMTSGTVRNSYLYVDGHALNYISSFTYRVCTGSTFPHPIITANGSMISFTPTTVILKQAQVSFIPCANSAHTNTNATGLHYKGTKYTLTTNNGYVTNNSEFYNFRVASGASIATASTSYITIYSTAQSLTLKAEYPGLNEIYSNTIEKVGLKDIPNSSLYSSYSSYAKPNITPTTGSFTRSGSTENKGYFALSSADTTYQVARLTDFKYLFPKWLQSNTKDENILFSKGVTGLTSTNISNMGLSLMSNQMLSGMAPTLHNVYGPTGYTSVNNYSITGKENMVVSDYNYSAITNAHTLVKSATNKASIFAEDCLPPLKFRIINDTEESFSLCVNNSCLSDDVLEFEWKYGDLMVTMTTISSGYNGAYCLFNEETGLYLPIFDNNYLDGSQNDSFYVLNGALSYRYHKHQILPYATLSDDGYYELKIKKYDSILSNFTTLEIIGDSSLSDSAEIDFSLGYNTGSTTLLNPIVQSATTVVRKNSNFVIGVHNNKIDQIFHGTHSIVADNIYPCKYKIDNKRKYINIGWEQNGVITKYDSLGLGLTTFWKDISSIMNFSNKIIIYSGTTASNNSNTNEFVFETSLEIVIINRSGKKIEPESFRISIPTCGIGYEYIPENVIAIGKNLLITYNLGYDLTSEPSLYIKPLNNISGTYDFIRKTSTSNIRMVSGTETSFKLSLNSRSVLTIFVDNYSV
jgi:hypothetical protein